VDGLDEEEEEMNIEEASEVLQDYATACSRTHELVGPGRVFIYVVRLKRERHARCCSQASSKVIV